MKSVLKKILQTLLGFDNYLFIFSLYIIYTLRWNKKEGDFLHFLKTIPENKDILDIGANIGIMTVHLARNFKNSTIFAFEPMPDNLKALQRIIRFFHLKNVTILNHALGNENGTIEMVMPVVRSVKMQGLSHVVDDGIDSFNEGEKYSVKIHKLDDVKDITQKDIKIGAIKMDVENFEYQVLEGGKKLIEKHRPIIYTELWDNQNRKDCFKFASDLNYKIKVLVNSKLVEFEPAKHKTQNFFLLPEESQL